jgi:hypothetical protein
VGYRYALSGENLTLGTGNVLAAVQSDAAGNQGAILRLLRAEVSQNGTPTPAQVRLAISLRNALGTLTVTLATPQNLALGGPASGVVGGTNPLTVGTCGVNSSADTGGTYTDKWPVNPNNVNGWLWLPTPEERILVPPSTLVCVRFLVTPGTLTGWTVVLVWDEEF